jgi:hypothetical protein
MNKGREKRKQGKARVTEWYTPDYRLPSGSFTAFVNCSRAGMGKLFCWRAKWKKMSGGPT